MLMEREKKDNNRIQERRRSAQPDRRQKAERSTASPPRARQRREGQTRAAKQPTAMLHSQRASKGATPKVAPKPRKVEQKQRHSIGAETAQRRRADREENARLTEAREKQKRQAKQRVRRRISPDTWKRVCIMGAVVFAVVLSMVIFFRVQRVQIVGNHYYAAEEIRKAADVSEGDNLLTLSRGQIAGNVIAKLPYVKTVRVTRQLPDSVVIQVTEYDATYAIQDNSGAYYLITSGGKVTEPVEEREAKGRILVEEVTINPPTVGEVIQLCVPEGKEAEAQTWRASLLALLKEIESAELTKEIASVCIPSAYQLSLKYGNRFDVRLGNSTKLAYKLEFLKVVISEQKDYVSGSIDLSLNSGNEAHVIKDE